MNLDEMCRKANEEVARVIDRGVLKAKLDMAYDFTQARSRLGLLPLYVNATIVPEKPRGAGGRGGSMSSFNAPYGSSPTQRGGPSRNLPAGNSYGGRSEVIVNDYHLLYATVYSSGGGGGADTSSSSSSDCSSSSGD